MRITIGILPLIILTGCKADDPAENCLNTWSAKFGAYHYSQSFVEKKLRSPSTAEFPKYSASGVIVKFERACHFKVLGYVDAQNAFGGTIRTRYIIDMEADPKVGGYWGRNLIID